MNYLVGYSKSAELKSTIDGGNTDKRCCDFISLLIMILMQVFLCIVSFTCAFIRLSIFYYLWRRNLYYGAKEMHVDTSAERFHEHVDEDLV